MKVVGCVEKYTLDKINLQVIMKFEVIIKRDRRVLELCQGKAS
jgi:hypothetical protein